MKKSFLTAWEQMGQAIMTKDNHDGLPATCLQEIRDRFRANADADPNGFFNLIGVIYAAGYYKGHEAAQPRAAVQGGTQAEILRDMIHEAAAECNDESLLDLVYKLLVAEGVK